MFEDYKNASKRKSAMKIVEAENAPAAIGPYSQGIVSTHGKSGRYLPALTSITGNPDSLTL